MKYNRNILGLGIATVCLAGGIVNAAPSITGYVDETYNYNFAKNSGPAANAYDEYSPNTKTFDLNTAHLSISGSDSATGVGYDIETDFGTDAALNDPNSPSGLFDVQQAFLTYAFGPGRAWGLKAGKYDTYEGIEVTAAGSNPTISRGLLFTLAEPISHTGLELNYTQGMMDLHLGLVNGWDQVLDVNTTPTGLAKIGLNWGDPLALTISGLVGEENFALAGYPALGDTKGIRTSVDVTGVTHVVKMVDINFQGNYGMQAHASALSAGKTATWYGFGVQPLLHVNSMWELGLRYEFFNDLDGARANFGVKQIIQDVSLAPTYTINKYLTARVEYRVDFSNKKVFINTDKNQQIISADLIATF
jgi:hypothetical protein